MNFITSEFIQLTVLSELNRRGSKGIKETCDECAEALTSLDKALFEYFQDTAIDKALYKYFQEDAKTHSATQLSDCHTHNRAWVAENMAKQHDTHISSNDELLGKD